MGITSSNTEKPPKKLRINAVILDHEEKGTAAGLMLYRFLYPGPYSQAPARPVAWPVGLEW